MSESQGGSADTGRGSSREKSKECTKAKRRACADGSQGTASHDNGCMEATTCRGS